MVHVLSGRFVNRPDRYRDWRPIGGLLVDCLAEDSEPSQRSLKRYSRAAIVFLNGHKNGGVSAETRWARHEP